MPKSRNRKAHKKKSAARTQSIKQRRQYAMSLVNQLEEQLQIVRDNPTTGVDIQASEPLTITGTLPSHDIF
jgi:HPt (histidine-containing phosphotransfer) domain-containing protein